MAVPSNPRKPLRASEYCGLIPCFTVLFSVAGFSGYTSPHFSPDFCCCGGSGHVYCVALGGFLDVLSSTPAESSVALAGKRQMRLVATPVCAASLRNLVR